MNNNKIRNKYHEVEGSYSDEQILESIEAGKYTGEEEVSASPYIKWQKLASHPKFYDVFLRKLYKEKYNFGEKKQETKENEEQEEQKGRDPVTSTRRQEFSEFNIQKPHSEIQEGKTFNVEEVEKLFDKKSRSGAEVVNILAEPIPKEDSIKIKELTGEDGAQEPQKQTGEKRRFLFLSLVLTLSLIFLFRFGSQGNPEAVKEAEYITQTTMPAPAEETSKADLYETSSALYQEGLSYYQMGNPIFYKGAVNFFKDALLWKTEQIEVQSKLAESLARLISEKSTTDLALAEIRKIIESGRSKEPQNSGFYRAEAIVALSLERYADAKKLAVMASEADPTNSENLLINAEVAYYLGDYSTAILLLNEANKDITANARLYYLRARSELALGNSNKAEENAKLGISINPLNAQAYYLKADIYSGQNRLKEAKVYYELAAKLAPFLFRKEKANVYYRLGELNELLNKEEVANKYYFLARAESPELMTGNKDKTNRKLSDANITQIKTELGLNSDYLIQRGQELYSENKFNEALRFFQAAQLIFPKREEVVISLGDTMNKLIKNNDDFKKVSLHYIRAIEENPKNAKAYVRLGIIETEQYNFNKGYQLIKKGISLEERNYDAHLALGKHYFKRQDYIRAREELAYAKGILSTDAEVYYYYGRLLLIYDKRKIREAMELFSTAFSLNPQHYDALSEWLKLKLLTYEKNFAIKFLRSLIESDPKNAQNYWVLGEVYSSNSEFRRAITHYHKSLDLEARSSKVRMSLARAHEAVGEIDQAISEYNEASKTDRRNPEGFYEATRLLLGEKNYESAEIEIRALLSISANYPGAQRYLSKIYAAKGKKEESLTAMKKEVENNPQNYKFLLELAELYMSYQMIDEAIVELSKIGNLPSEEKAPEYKEVRITAFLLLSGCYRIQGKPQNAEGAVKLGISIDPANPILHRELGYVYHDLQRPREAVKEFEFYLGRSPAATDVEKLKNKIKEMIIDY